MRANTVGRRAFWIILSISLCFITLSVTVFSLFEYRRRSAVIEREIATLRDAEMAGITKGLWDYDSDILYALIEGFSFYPYIRYVEIRDLGTYTISRGTDEPDNPGETFPLVRKMPGGSEEMIGFLLIKVDRDKILSDVTGQVLMSLFLQVIFLIFELFIIILIFSRMVTRHLVRIAAQIKDFDDRPGAPPLSLQRESIGDELDLLVQSFNTMQKTREESREAEIRANKELRLSEERYRVIVEEAPDAILLYDVELGRFISYNRRALEIFGRSGEELLSRKPTEFFAPVQPDNLPIEESFERNALLAVSGESVMTRRNLLDPRGNTITCETRITPFPGQGRKILLATYRDITESVHAEESISLALREKDTLLKEVYHRTKNNMQVIAAFLNMEAMYYNDERIIKILNEMIGRITSMALVHQNLYESRDLSRIDLGDYIDDLAMEMRQSYLGGRPEVTLLTELEPGIISLIDTAVPCGLILNECVLNAIKYAFPDSRGGTIVVGLSRGDADTLNLKVEDDGAGFPAGFDPERDGRLGLQTVISLTDQLHGTVVFRRREESGSGRTGISCEMTIRDNLYESRV